MSCNLPGDQMKRLLPSLILALLLLAGLAKPILAQTATEDAVKALYQRFVTAQNERDLAAVRAVLWDNPNFLWISDGKAFWGAERMIERMSAYQRADTWHVTPDYGRARLVVLDERQAVLFQPLRLTLGPRNGERSIDFLVNVQCIKTPQGWRIAALYTTDENP